MRCERCDGEVNERYRFCPWCAAPLRTKLVEHFAAHPLIERQTVALRVSRYLTDQRHTRFSIWNADGAAAAISLDEVEAARLSRFIGAGEHAVGKSGPGLRASAQALITELKSVARR